MARLKVMKDGAELQSVDLGRLGKSELRLGRAEECDIRLDDRAVGREHALFLINSNGLVVQKKSKFGKLSVNGAEAAEAALKAGDVIMIADYLVRVEEETAQTPAASPLAVETGQLNLTAPAIPAPDALTSELKPSESAPPASDSPPPPADPSQATADAQALPPIGEAAGEPNIGMEGSEAAGMDSGGDGERTAMVSQSKVVIQLVFNPGDANVTEFEIKKKEVSLGRGTNCDIVLNDKKASRKHLVIHRVGMNFVAKDLGSGNGTYVNGVKISEQELAGDDVLRIGSTEFTFKALSQEYLEQEQAQAFMPVPAQQPEQEAAPAEGAPELGLVPMDGAAQAGLALPGVASVAPGMMDAGLGGAANLTGSIPGLGQSAPKKKETLLDKFKRQPTPRKIMIVVGVLGALMFFNAEDEDPKKKKPEQQTQQFAPDSPEAAFQKLPKERKEFVINQYQLAFDLYKNKEYERAVYEVDKLLQTLPTGYKDARDIKNFAVKSIEIQKSIEEEKRRKELEEKLRQEVATLVSEAQLLVDQGKDAEAKEKFAAVLERDPDNPTVLRLRQQIEERDQQKKLEAEAAKEREFKLKQLEEVLTEARGLLKAGKYYAVMERLQDAKTIFAGNEKLLARAQGIVADARSTLKAKVQPFLSSGKSAFDEGNYTVARDAYYKALKVDYRNVEAKQGLDKIREILHDRAKKIYTDAVIAESISDFKLARVKYKECFDQAMREDIYYGRCFRKFKRFELVDRSAAASTTDSPGSPVSGNDPQKPALPQAVDVEGDEGAKSPASTPPELEGGK